MGALTTAVFVVGTAMSLVSDARDHHARAKAIEVGKATLNCGSGVKIVSYRFEGEPGSTVTYAGQKYTFGDDGEIEVLVDKKTTTYSTPQGTFAIGEARADAFGAVTIDAVKNAMVDPIVPASTQIASAR